ncbi:MAG: PDZ domain-containing protein [Oscillospiraceae bacterium]|nr:PDZ domain-containing protein [Oscillospiraceae bacterium]
MSTQRPKPYNWEEETDWRNRDPWEELPRRRGARRRGVPVLVFLLCLLLIAGVTAALVLTADLPRQLDLYRYPQAPAPEPTTAAHTTLERAPAAQGTELSLLPLPDGAPLSFQAIYQKAIPWVVSIRGQKETGYSLGTGVVATTAGHIITNDHVIEGCSTVDVTLQSGAIFPARLVGTDADSDLAVLQIQAGDLIPAEFGDSDALQVGDTALAIGNPLGEELRGTMTDGIISALNRDVTVNGKGMVLIQTTAALNHGNSGGVLLNIYGQVVGITNLKMSSYYSTVEGLGFAIPTATVKTVVEELLDHGYIANRPTIGITVAALTDEEADQSGVTHGLRVVEVEACSDAQAQGLQAGDIILAANGQEVHTGGELNGIKETMSVGDTINLRIFRAGDELEIPVQLMERYVLDQAQEAAARDP